MDLIKDILIGGACAALFALVWELVHKYCRRCRKN